MPSTAARPVVGALVRRDYLRRSLLVMGAGIRSWELRHMLHREGGSLSYDITFLHDPALGEIDERLRIAEEQARDKHAFQHVVRNDDVDRAVYELLTILEREARDAT